MSTNATACDVIEVLLSICGPSCVQEQRLVLRAGSLSVQYVAPSAYLQMDAASVAALEIIKPLQVPILACHLMFSLKPSHPCPVRCRLRLQASPPKAQPASFCGSNTRIPRAGRGCCAPTSCSRSLMSPRSSCARSAQLQRHAEHTSACTVHADHDMSACFTLRTDDAAISAITPKHRTPWKSC